VDKNKSTVAQIKERQAEIEKRRFEMERVKEEADRRERERVEQERLEEEERLRKLKERKERRVQEKEKRKELDNQKVRDSARAKYSSGNAFIPALVEGGNTGGGKKSRVAKNRKNKHNQTGNTTTEEKPKIDELNNPIVQESNQENGTNRQVQNEVKETQKEPEIQIIQNIHPNNQPVGSWDDNLEEILKEENEPVLNWDDNLEELENELVGTKSSDTLGSWDENLEDILQEENEPVLNWDDNLEDIENEEIEENLNNSDFVQENMDNSEAIEDEKIEGLSNVKLTKQEIQKKSEKNKERHKN